MQGMKCICEGRSQCRHFILLLSNWRLQVEPKLQVARQFASRVSRCADVYLSRAARRSEQQ